MVEVIVTNGRGGGGVFSVVVVMNNVGKWERLWPNFSSSGGCRLVVMNEQCQEETA